MHANYIYSTLAIDAVNADCAIDNSNTLPFKIILMIGIVFVTISAVVSFYIDRVDRKKLLSTSMVVANDGFAQLQYENYECFSNLSVAWLTVSALAGVAVAFVQNFYAMTICFMIFLSCGLCGGIISAISVALFPTNFRWANIICCWSDWSKIVLMEHYIVHHKLLQWSHPTQCHTFAWKIKNLCCVLFWNDLQSNGDLSDSNVRSNWCGWWQPHCWLHDRRQLRYALLRLRRRNIESVKLCTECNRY